MIIYLPLQARLNRTLDYSLLCHRLEIATERYNNNVPAKFTQQGCSILFNIVFQEIDHSVFWPQIFHTDGVHV